MPRKVPTTSMDIIAIFPSGTTALDRPNRLVEYVIQDFAGSVGTYLLTSSSLLRQDSIEY